MGGHGAGEEVRGVSDSRSGKKIAASAWGPSRRTASVLLWPLPGVAGANIETTNRTWGSTEKWEVRGGGGLTEYLVKN